MQGVAQCNKKSELHKARLEKLLASAEGGMGMLHRITKPLPWRSGEQVIEEKFDDAQPTRVEVKQQEWKLHWQVITLEHVLEDKPWQLLQTVTQARFARSSSSCTIGPSVLAEYLHNCCPSTSLAFQ